MTEGLSEFVRRILESPIWEQFWLVRAQAPTSGNIFSFSEYLAALALLLVVMIASDFRFRYRLSLTRTDLRKVGFWVGLIVGTAMLAIDVWFQNGLPIPKLMANSNNLKAALGLVFLAFVFWVISVAVIRPPVYNKANSKKFFNANYHLIHQGNADRMQVIAEELLRSLHSIVIFATKLAIMKNGHNMKRTPREEAYAYDFLLLVAGRQFCQIVVDKVPAFAFALIEEVKNQSTQHLPIFPFVRNIGQEFIKNKNSSLYQEQNWHDSGLFGYIRPVTTIVFGSYEFVEMCAKQGGSPLDMEYGDFSEFDETQMEGFTRASLAFLEGYVKATRGRYYSQALTRTLEEFEISLNRAHEMNGVENYRKTAGYVHMRAVVKFINDAIDIVEEHAEKPTSFRAHENGPENIFDELAKLIFETSFAASTVSSPVWTAWSIQHNTVWSRIWRPTNAGAHRIIAFKVRRLLYDEIKRMDRFANFRGARLLGFCLNVLGLKVTDRHKGYQREFYPLQAAAVGWVQANYKTLLDEHPKVAEACLQGQISYDANNHRLIQTYSDIGGKYPQREVLYLD